MTTHRLHDENGNFFIRKEGGSFFINSNPPNIGPYDSGYYCIGSPTDVESFCHDPSCFYHSGGPIYTWCNTINGPYSTLEECEAACSVPDVTGNPLTPSGFSYEGSAFFTSPGFLSQSDRVNSCNSSNLGDQDLDFSWNKNNPVTDPVDFYIIRRVTGLFIGDDTSPHGFPDGYNGQYCINNSNYPYGGGGLDFNTPFEPFIVTSTSGTAGTFGAMTVYGSGSSYGRLGYQHSLVAEPRYVNGLGIESLEFNNSYGPKIVFRDAESKGDFFTGAIGESGINFIPMLLYGASGSQDDYDFLYDGTNGFWTLHPDNIIDEGSNYITFSGVINPTPYANLLNDLESRGLDNNYLYIQIGFDGTYRHVRDPCSVPITLASDPNPRILPRYFLETLNPTGDEYAWQFTDFGCGDYYYQLLSVNHSGQCLLPSPYNEMEISSPEQGWVNKAATDARINDNGLNDFVIRYGGVNGFDGYFPVPDIPGTTYYLLYASGWLYDTTGNLVSTATSTNSAGTGGELLLVRPAQGWYRVEAEEQWRISGPSGEESPIIHSMYCGPNDSMFQFVSNP